MLRVANFQSRGRAVRIGRNCFRESMMGYTIKLDRSGCSGHARCAAIDPDLFPLDDQGYSIADGVVVPEGRERIALRGVRSCPEQVLTLVDEDGNPVRKLD